MKLHEGIDEVYAAEASLVRELGRLADRHTADPDIVAMSHTLTRRCGEHLQHLAPHGNRYGAGPMPDLGGSKVVGAVRRTASALTATTAAAGPLLLADLRQVYLAAHDAEIAWVVLLQAALAVRDSELIGVAGTCQEEAQHRWQWLRTRIKTSAPQILAT